jgi:tRNA-specific 2-thiouridylase
MLKREIVHLLGSSYKTQIREIAAKNSFNSLSRKNDSLGICFIEGNNYSKFLQKEGVKSEYGNFVNTERKIFR